MLSIVVQDKEYKTFKESLKLEQKLLKQEVDIMPKNDRKEMFKRRKDVLDYEQAERVYDIWYLNMIFLTVPVIFFAQEKQFVENQQREHDATIKRLQESHRQKIALLEKQFLQQKHQLLRGTVVFFNYFRVFFINKTFFRQRSGRLGAGEKTIARKKSTGQKSVERNFLFTTKSNVDSTSSSQIFIKFFTFFI